ncbi:Lipopolysaccharide assembly protein B [Sinobacterium norvegicum]|uniref:Lipopolysaccharide assembly protein B n=1 Tax=Sinobacterium norvegicum TaxID=1641715 RepID=A0ABM9AC25_9GAMM|nr:lipopolysaccharide assembly protein LapB [Sinobacterium norvegicum]CAH0990752.1 Lipopolysaccharide assembly protein B [Sinobacterium norvegicum]
MQDFATFILLLSAVSIGWLLGRYRRSKKVSLLPAVNAIPTSYYQSLNLLISNDDSNDAVESFIESFEVNSSTLATHISLGNLLRERGDTEGATRIHQNLLARTNLSIAEQHQAHIALAKDYAQAGLLDRAESLLDALVEEGSEYLNTALKELVGIYQEQRDWQLAIDAGRRLIPKRLLRSKRLPSSALSVAISHYCCELAEQHILAENWRETRALLRQALDFDPKCVRSNMISGRLSIEAGHYRQAIKVLEQIAEQDPLYINEVVDSLAYCYQQSNDISGFIRFAERLLRQQVLTSVLMQLVLAIRSQQGEDQARECLLTYMKRRPTLLGIIALVEMYRGQVNDQSSLDLLTEMLDALVARNPLYRCGDCGFAGKQLHWQCPSCKAWGGVAPVIGIDGQ